MEEPKETENSFDKNSAIEESQKQKQDQQFYELVSSLNRIFNPPTITIPGSLVSAIRATFKSCYPIGSMPTNEALKDICETINKIRNYNMNPVLARMIDENRKALFLNASRNLLEEEPKYRAEKDVFNNFVKDKEKEYLKKEKEKEYEYSEGVILIADCLGTKKSWEKNNIQGYVKKIYDTRSKLEAVLKSRSDYINSKSKYEKYSDFFEIGFSCCFLSDTFVGIMKQTKKHNKKERHYALYKPMQLATI